MKNSNVLILDKNKNRLNELKTRLLEKNVSIGFPEKPEDLNKLLSMDSLKIVLISQQYLSKISKEEIKTLFRQANSRSIIVYDVQNNATRRLAFYKLGAYRVLDNTFDSSAITEYACNVLKQHNDSGVQKDIRFSGSLIDFSLADLINSFGRDKVSGVLRVYTPYCSGKIIFNKGDIDDASSGYHLGEEAVIFMLTWMTGNFTMRKCHIKFPKHKVLLSNIGLLLYGERIRSKFNEVMKKFGHPGVSLKLINKGDLVHQFKNPFYKEVADKLTNFTVLQEVLAFSQINVLNLISWLHSLLMTNHLELRDDSGMDVESLPESEQYQKTGLGEHLLGGKEVNYLRRILNAEEISTGKLLVLSTDLVSKTDFINIFNQGGKIPVRTNKELDYTRIDLDDYFSLNVFGISVDQKLKDTIDKISEGLLGYIVLIDAQKHEEFEYAHYIINYLSELYSVPWTVAVTNLTEDNYLLDKVEATTKLPAGRSLIPCDINQKEDIKNVILSLK